MISRREFDRIDDENAFRQLKNKHSHCTLISASN